MFLIIFEDFIDDDDDIFDNPEDFIDDDVGVCDANLDDVKLAFSSLYNGLYKNVHLDRRILVPEKRPGCRLPFPRCSNSWNTFFFYDNIYWRYWIKNPLRRTSEHNHKHNQYSVLD